MYTLCDTSVVLFLIRVLFFLLNALAFSCVPKNCIVVISAMLTMTFATTFPLLRSTRNAVYNRMVRGISNQTFDFRHTDNTTVNPLKD